MKTWLVVGVVATFAGLGFFLVAAKRPAPAPVGDIPDTAINIAAAQSPAPAAAPVYLDRVVDVSDLDSLLDPPPIPVSEPRTEAGPVITRVGYEEPASPKAAGTTVPPIPKSAPDEPRIIIHSEEEITETEETQPILYEPGDGLDSPLPSWEDEFRPVGGTRTESIPLESAVRLRRPHWGRLHMLEAQREFDLHMGLVWNPLNNDDLDLFKREVPAPDWFVAEPKHESLRTTVLRAYSLFHIENQRPASRAEWYTRWHGEQRLTNMISDEAYAARIRDLAEQPGFARGIYGLFGGN